MKIPYNIIRSWTKFKGTPEELRSLIDLHITEVEELIESGKFSHMVVGEILEINPHPNADKLQVTQTKVGDETIQIVCGAKNIQVGQKVPVALPGSVIASGMEIGEANLRGVDSFGMLCSGTELGFTDTADGVMILESDFAPGTPLAQIFDEVGATALDLKVLANRPDYMSFLSIAREVAASMGEDFTHQLNVEYPVSRKFTTESQLTVKQTLKEELCPRYTARVVKGVSVGESPVWIQNILTAVGMKPINNLVDIGNLVMLETGQPIHIFDLAKLKRATLTIRTGKAGEKIEALDGETYALTSEDIVIADGKGAVAIAGIIGGNDSAVTNETTDIAIEIANFSRRSIRRSGRRLGLRTDASSRFERGVDLHLANTAMDRLLNLITETNPACQVGKGTIDIHKDLPPTKRELSFDIEKIRHLCDMPLTNSQITKILSRLNLEAEVNGKTLKLTVPSLRSDLVGAEDIAEELIRIHGLDQIPTRFPVAAISPVELPATLRLRRRLVDLAVRLQGVELKTHPFHAGADKDAIRLHNPLNENWTHLKTNLLHGLLEFEYESSDINIFEINKVFIPEKKGANIPAEATHFAMRVDGKGSYVKARSLLSTIFAELGVADDYRELPSGLGLEIIVDGNRVGEIIYHTDLTSGFWIDLDLVSPYVVWTKQVAELPKYPGIKFDLAFEINAGIRTGQMQDEIIRSHELVAKAELFDIFELPANKRSVAFHVLLRSPERTLTKEDRDAAQQKIVDTLERKFQAKLR